MAAIGFDPLEYAHELEASGMPRAQAEVVAKGMTAQFIHNFDALVTKDYLDSRIGEVTARMDARLDRMDARLDRMDVRFDGIDARLDRMDARFDAIDNRLNHTDIRFERIDGQFGKVYVLLGISIATTAIPAPMFSTPR